MERYEFLEKLANNQYVELDQAEYVLAKLAGFDMSGFTNALKRGKELVTGNQLKGVSEELAAAKNQISSTEGLMNKFRKAKDLAKNDVAFNEYAKVRGTQAGLATAGAIGAGFGAKALFGKKSK